MNAPLLSHRASHTHTHTHLCNPPTLRSLTPPGPRLPIPVGPEDVVEGDKGVRGGGGAHNSSGSFSLTRDEDPSKMKSHTDCSKDLCRVHPQTNIDMHRDMVYNYGREAQNAVIIKKKEGKRRRRKNQQRDAAAVSPHTLTHSNEQTPQSNVDCGVGSEYSKAQLFV